MTGCNDSTITPLHHNFLQQIIINTTNVVALFNLNIFSSLNAHSTATILSSYHNHIISHHTLLIQDPHITSSSPTLFFFLNGNIEGLTKKRFSKKKRYNPSRTYCLIWDLLLKDKQHIS